jgi:hypothetical protein
MNQLANAKAIAAVIALLLAGAGLWYLYHSGYEAGKDEVQIAWDKDKLARDQAQQLALADYANKLKLAETQHDQDQAVIDKLHDDAGRVRIHLPACPGNAQARADPHGATGPLPDRVDQLFADFQERVGGLIARCDQLNIDARRMNKELGY